MKVTAASRTMHGFTLIELMVTLALVGVVAMTALPLYDVITTRMKEAELRQTLRTLRSALDAYKAAVDQGQIAVETGQSGYPPSLDVLAEGVDVKLDSVGSAVTASGRETPKRLVFLRQVPRDPFNTDPAIPAAQTWRTRSYGSPPENPQPGDDVYDVSSTSPRVGSNGIPYGNW